jgi:hypothetical protein
MADARAELRHLRQAIAAVAAEHDLAILACGTHPTAEWGVAEQTAERRYDAVMADLQMIGRRDMFCGMHVHVELPDPDARIDVMRRMLPYVPLLLALSTTGLMGYRLAGHDEQPRSGIPELFRTKAEFDAYVAALAVRNVAASAFLPASSSPARAAIRSRCGSAQGSSAPMSRIVKSVREDNVPHRPKTFINSAFLIQCRAGPTSGTTAAQRVSFMDRGASLRSGQQSL